MWAQSCPHPKSSRALPLPKVELLKCGESVLKTMKLVTEVQDPCSCLLLSVGILGSQIASISVPGVGLNPISHGRQLIPTHQSPGLSCTARTEGIQREQVENQRWGSGGGGTVEAFASGSVRGMSGPTGENERSPQCTK